MSYIFIVNSTECLDVQVYVVEADGDEVQVCDGSVVGAGLKAETLVPHEFCTPYLAPPDADLDFRFEYSVSKSECSGTYEQRYGSLHKLYTYEEKECTKFG